jgi:hypothetical protein
MPSWAAAGTAGDERQPLMPVLHDLILRLLSFWNVRKMRRQAGRGRLHEAAGRAQSR